MITVESTASDIHVIIPKDEVPPERVNSFLDWLRLKAIARRSAMSSEEPDRMAEEIKADWWAANKGRFIKPTEQ